MHNLLADLRHSIRALRKSPGLVLIATLSLGLGIGANTTLFSVFRAIFFGDVTAAEPDRVQHIWVGGSNRASYPNFRDMAASKGVSDLAGYSQIALNLRNGEEIERIMGQVSSGNFFQLLGVNAFLGRTFTADETNPGRDPRVVVIAYETWQTRFRSDKNILGRVLNINGYPFTVIGVLPRTYHAIYGYSMEPQFHVPLSKTLNPDWDKRTAPVFELIGRLAAGLTPTQSRDALLSTAKELQQRYPEDNKHFAKVDMYPISGIGKLRHEGFTSTLLLFFGVLASVVGLVLMIACANVAGLLLARGLNRSREIAVRLALGSSRARLIQSMLSESLVLAALGALAGFLVNLWCGSFLKHIRPPNMEGISLTLQVEPDWAVLAYSMGIAVVTALLCGFMPAWQASRVSVGPDLTDRSAQASRRRVTLRNALVVGQVAMSLLLLVTSLLFIRSLIHIGVVNPGFNVDHTMTASIDLDRNRYSNDRKRAFYERAMVMLTAMPGVQSASAAMIVPLTGNRWMTDFAFPGETPQKGRLTDVNAVAPAYFQSMDISIRRGREFEWSDRQGAVQVAVINTRFAERFFQGVDPIGKVVRLHEPPDTYTGLQIVGIAADSKYNTLGEDPKPMLYRAWTQTDAFNTVLNLKVAGSPSARLSPVKQALAALDPSAPVRVQTMHEAIAFAFFPHRMAAIILGAMGALGLLLATIGLYGVVAYAVNRRTAEIGIRMALGAGRGAVLGMVLRDGLGLVGTGIVLGLALAAVATRALTSFLAGVSPTDPVTFAAVTAILMVVGLVASYLPARRATRIDPMVALRYE